MFSSKIVGFIQDRQETVRTFANRVVIVELTNTPREEKQIQPYALPEVSLKNLESVVSEMLRAELHQVVATLTANVPFIVGDPS